MRPGRLRWAAVRLGPAFDLLANYEPGGFFFERGGMGVSGTGTATAIEGPHPVLSEAATAASDLLSHVRPAEDGPAAVAVGAFPFAGGAGRLALPSRTVVRSWPGRTWRLDVWREGLAPADHHRERWVGRAVPHDAFSQIQLRPDPEPRDYADAVAAATERIRGGALRKVVLARSLLVDAERRLEPKQLLWRLRAVDPDCYAFAVPTQDGATLVGATPELLVEKWGREVHADPLAGSSPRFGDPEDDRGSAERLVGSDKDREEHAVVVEAVAHALGPLCRELHHPREPELLGTANVWHLSTPFTGRLLDEVGSVLELVAALHPTPAVCGTPREEARRTLAELEPLDRGLYAGPVGWVDGHGDGQWAIALRCAEIGDQTARLFAGAGIVARSVPEIELDETERKFRALLDALRWG
ncbi:MAG TPA: isochorismate synthase [Actinomycetota bacterium]|nr:isochorismate synthase [Actinomycetota bacterium]